MNFILDLLFPKKCVGCGKLDTYFCKDCISNILQKDLICPECERAALGGQTHSFCRKRYGLDGLWSLGIYRGSLQEAIKKLKYGRVSDIAKYLADIIFEYWVKYEPLILEQIDENKKAKWTIIPVPLHWIRDNSRGFNQSAVIGQILSKKLGLAYCDGLKRIRFTKPQVKLKGYDRHDNIRGAFEISKPYILTPIPYILLIDDVWTTGSTLRECAYILKKNGAKLVWAITLAR